MYYIGGNSESVEQDVIHSYNMAYGGGGFAISYPLAKELVRILDGCINRYHSFYGSDQKVQACISEIGVPLTEELGFHQVDIRGNPYGLLAAHPLAPLVSLHHLDYVQPIFPGMNQIDSLHKLVKPYEIDPGRTLQQSFCHDLNHSWSVSVSWGYTIQLYPSLITAKQLETTFLTFQTWRSWSHDPFTFNTQPLSEDPCERPVVYFLDGIESVGQGQTLTRYKRHVEESYRSCDRPEYAGLQAVQFVNVTTASTLNHDIWNMAPRRQCCDIINGQKEVVEVNIRGCNQFESVTPP
ncbi:transferase, transferring glycosyl groups, putative [Ricinus communis]|uniref:Transferase, transferring glycosyl groups, putative n=2 Tax=Ricinus communis TaxID=3988 RepID=B9T426_RICCO|nr:transferase, transferring glycosyl groups, putative [Ricinus communis]